MCFSAMTEQDMDKLAREWAATVDWDAYEDIARGRWEGSRYKLPKAMDDAMVRHGGKVADLVLQWHKQQVSALEQEMFAQRKRANEAERALAVKPTKKAETDLRVGRDKEGKARAAIEDLRRTEAKARDTRIFPGVYSSVIVEEAGQRLVRPMRYQCRPVGKPSFYDTKYPGTYNARRDSLGGFWKGLFGQSHALMVASRFFENVEGPDGKNVVLEFVPKTGEEMLIACLWSHWQDPRGKEPPLYSFAAITDEPEPEVAAAGHDRTIINIKPEHADAWLRPGGNLAAMQAIFDDTRHPYYEHREAA